MLTHHVCRCRTRGSVDASDHPIWRTPDLDARVRMIRDRAVGFSGRHVYFDAEPLHTPWKGCDGSTRLLIAITELSCNLTCGPVEFWAAMRQLPAHRAGVPLPEVSWPPEHLRVYATLTTQFTVRWQVRTSTTSRWFETTDLDPAALIATLADLARQHDKDGLRMLDHLSRGDGRPSRWLTCRELSELATAASDALQQA